jgi:hypothetical protein
MVLAPTVKRLYCELDALAHWWLEVDGSDAVVE